MMQDISVKIQMEMDRISRACEEKYCTKVNDLQAKLNEKQIRAVSNREKHLSSTTEKNHARKKKISYAMETTGTAREDLKEKLARKMSSSAERKRHINARIVGVSQKKSLRVKSIQDWNYNKIKKLAVSQEVKLTTVRKNKNKILSDISSNVKNVTHKKQEDALMARELYNLEKMSVAQKKHEHKMQAVALRRDIILANIRESNTKKRVKDMQNDKKKNVGANKMKKVALSDISASISSCTNIKKQVAPQSTANSKIWIVPRNNKVDVKPLKLVSALRGNKQGTLQVNRSNSVKNNESRIMFTNLKETSSRNDTSLHHFEDVQESNCEKINANKMKKEYLDKISSNVADMRNKKHRRASNTRNMKELSVRKKMEYKMKFAAYRRNAIIEEVVTSNHDKTLKVKVVQEKNSMKLKKLMALHQAKHLAAQQQKKEYLENASFKAKSVRNKKSIRALITRDVTKGFKALSTQKSLEHKMICASERKHTIISERQAYSKTLLFQVEAVKDDHCEKVKKLSNFFKTKMLSVNQRKKEALSEISLNIANTRKTKHQHALISREVKMLWTQDIHENKMKDASYRKDAILSELSNNKTLLKVKRGRRRNSLKMKSLMILHEAKIAAVNQRKEEVLTNISSNVAYVRNKKHQRAFISRDIVKQYELLSIQREHEYRMNSATQRRDIRLALIAAVNKKKQLKVKAVQRKNSLTATKLKALNELKVLAVNQRKVAALSKISSNCYDAIYIKLQHALKAMDTQLHLAQKIENKMKSAIKRKDVILAKISASNNKRILNVSSIQHENSCKVKNLKSFLEANVLAVCRRKQENLLEISRNVANIRKNKNERAFISRESQKQVLLSIQQKHENRMKYAVASNSDKMLKTKIMQDKNSFKRDTAHDRRFKQLLSIQKKTKQKMLTVLLRKECCLYRFAKMAKIRKEKHQCASISRELKSLSVVTKHEGKMTYATHCRDVILADVVAYNKKKVIKIKAAQEKKIEKLLLLQKEMQHKMHTALIHKNDTIVKIVQSNKKEILKGKVVKDENVQKVRKLAVSLDAKLFGAHQRRNEMLSNISSEIAKSRSVKLQRAFKAKNTRRTKTKNRELAEEEKQSEDEYYQSMFDGEFSDITLDNDSVSKSMQANTQKVLKLSDIELLQSITLAEEASLNGKDEFRTVDNLCNLDRVALSVSLSQNKPVKSKFLSRMKKVKNHISGFEKVKENVGEKMRVIPVSIRLHLPFSN